MSDWKIVVNGSVMDFEDDYGFKVQQYLGAGMPPINNVQTDLAIQDGGVFQRSLADVRVMTLLGFLSGSDVSSLHTKRRNLIDVVKPDRTASPQAIELQYAGGTTTVQASAFYDAGLELGRVLGSNELNIGLRFVFFDPFWETLNSASSEIEPMGVLTYHNFLYYDGDGTWTSASLNDAVNALIFDASANLFIGGDFTTINGSAFPYMAKFDGTNFTAPIASGNGDIKAFTFIGKDLYVTGSITSIDGVTVNRIAKFDGSTWSALGDGLNGAGRALAVSKGGNLYVGGQQSATDGSLVTGAISKWDGSTWSIPGNGSVVAIIEAMAVDSNDVLFAAGTSTSFGGVAASFIAKLDSTGSWQNVSGGSVDGSIQALAFGPDSNLFVAGCLTKANEITVNGIAQNNGTGWQTLADGSTGSIGVTSGSLLALGINSDNGIVHVGGDFSGVGGLGGTTNIAQWIGTSWRRELIDVKRPTSSTAPKVLALAVDGATGQIAIGFSGSEIIFAPCPVTITNSGTGAIWPIVTLDDSVIGGSFFDLVNYTTETIIDSNYFRTAGEEARLDLREGEKTFISDVSGNIIDSILPGAQLASWNLIPGDNKISIRSVVGNTTGSAKISFNQRFWSIDT